MKLPKQVQNSQSGQILIIFLLILVVGLAIVLSIASRTVTDVRQTTTSDESNRAYFAAESGIENALKKIQDGSLVPSSSPNTSAGVNLQNVNRTNADVSVVSLTVPSGIAFEFPNPIAKDDVAQVNLMSKFSDITTAGVTTLTPPSVPRTSGLKVYWGAGAAIEVSVITCDSAPASTCSSTPAFHIYKWTFDQNAAARSNGFCATLLPPPGSITTTEGSNRPFTFAASFSFSTASPSCPVNDVFASTSENPVLARIRVLYAGPIPVAVIPTVGDLPDQGSRITSVGSTPSGVTRKLTVTRLYPALPAIFDYVLYNGSTKPLSKP